ncbi:hypothetical protein P7228_09290 [Altererythrobacter arenosus]|uniref:Secreted protein n=1 Tax=Altererythrobacter arenosus TaxID=3032592 RepID=A0ABY8FME5_9SPHN|nr:hypothetical protein [Altererythrobacter sp. CAU 1644]WFL76194.1 hypothetical protein P7228_09290 [Altererythrobacter sp. CAU 1644]
MKLVALLAIASLVPLGTGPLPTEKRTLAVALCDGGTLSIPLGNDEDAPSPCPAKACHAGTCRKQIDSAQRRAR